MIMINELCTVKKIIENCRNYPENNAINDITYGNLGKLICGLSSKIEGSRVAIICCDVTDAYIGMLAALHAGITYCPINLDAPLVRQNQILERFEPTDIIISSGQERDFPNALVVGKKAEIIDQIPSANPAYVMFTSGSTGDPKGVVISRKSLDHFVNWAVPAMDLNIDSRVSQHPNIAFDLSIMDSFCTLYSGGNLFPLISKINRTYPGRFISSNALTHWVSVSSVIDLMSRDKKLDLSTFASLKKMIFCGEPLLPRHLDFIFSLNSELTVLNTYGPTEATVAVTKIELTNTNWKEKVRISAPLGAPVNGMKLHLEGDVTSNAGEIIIEGPQVAEGYWKDCDQTSNVFYDGKYKTGDWGEVIDGEIYFKSRIDRQIKVNGFRLELGDIEDLIYSVIKYVVACIYVDQKIIAFIEADHLTSDNCYKLLATQMPQHSIPTEINFLEILPRNLNDKIDYKKIESSWRKNER
jgi:D-alanine--poly(phosphoribitol) ligase subunit 1